MKKSYELLYTFTKNNNPNWKQNFLLINEKETMAQGYLSDYELFNKYRQQGFETQALLLIEKLLFQNSNILFTTIMDFFQEKRTSAMALKMGYGYNTDKIISLKRIPI